MRCRVWSKDPVSGEEQQESGRKWRPAKRTTRGYASDIILVDHRRDSFLSALTLISNVQIYTIATLRPPLLSTTQC